MSEKHIPEQKEMTLGIPAPFILWTLQRTGGTNLAQGLYALCASRKGYQEPFNTGRIFGHLSDAWTLNPDRHSLDHELALICASGVCIKQCVEEVPDAINEALLSASINAGYKHVFLYRDKPLDRILSYHFSRQTGIWIRKKALKTTVDEAIFATPLPVQSLLEHEQRCIARLNHAWQALQQAKAPVHVVSFEDLYAGNSQIQARKQLIALLQFLQMDITSINDYQLNKIIARGEQGTKDQYKNYSGIQQLRRGLQSLTPFCGARPGTRKPRLAYARYDRHVIAHLAVWVREPDENNEQWIDVGGVLVLSTQVSETGTLWLRSDAGLQPLVWTQDSPAMARRFPQNPHAQSARFNTLRCRLHSSVPVQLLLRDGSGKEMLLCEIHAT